MQESQTTLAVIAWNEPQVFEQLRLEQQKQPRETTLALANQLASSGDSLLALRATQLIMSIDPNLAQQYVLQALLSSDQVVHLGAKAYIAYFDLRQAWTHQEHPQFETQAVPIVLEAILEGIRQHKPRSTLTLELELWIRLMLCDLYVLLERFDIVKMQAAEAKLLAKSLRLANLEQIALYQIGIVAMNQGDSNHAIQLFESIYQHSLSGEGLSGRARRALIITLLKQGDENGVVRLIDSSTDQNGIAIAQYAALRLATLRFEPTDWLESSKGAANHTAGMAQMYAHIMTAQSHAPDQPDLMRESYQAALRVNLGLHSVRTGNGELEIRIWQAFLALRCNEIALLSVIPNVADLNKLAIGSRVFGLAVHLEVLMHNPTELAIEISHLLDTLTTELQAIEPRVLVQILMKLQLLTPRVLALAAYWHHVHPLVLDLGNQCLLNVLKRPIAVYNKQGLRPMQAAEMILNAFFIPATFMGRGGGSQNKAIKEVLYRDYHARKVWYQPVSAAYIAFILLCTRAVEKDSRRTIVLRKNIQMLRTKFGFVPKLQITDESFEFSTLEKVLTQFEQGLITADSATQLLFAKGAL
jgi:tetratricopeptide (TPR) repeat protein